MQGPAVVPAPVSPPLLVTPIGRLSTVRPTAGATNAAPGQQVGATSLAPAQMVQPTLPNIVPQVAGAVPIVMYSAPPPTPAEQAAAQAAAAGPGTQTAAMPETNVQIGRFDFGMAPISGVVDGVAERRSVAEVAAAYRRRGQAEIARSYTNEDINRLNPPTGASVGGGGVAGAAAGAGAPAERAQPSQPSGAVAAPTGPAQAAPGSQPTTERPPAPPSQRVQPEPPQEQARSRPPEPQGQAPAQGEQARGTASEGRLPASSSSLPLLAVLGFMAAAVGLLTRK